MNAIEAVNVIGCWLLASTRLPLAMSYFRLELKSKAGRMEFVAGWQEAGNRSQEASGQQPEGFTSTVIIVLFRRFKPDLT